MYVPIGLSGRRRLEESIKGVCTVVKCDVFGGSFAGSEGLQVFAASADRFEKAIVQPELTQLKQARTYDEKQGVDWDHGTVHTLVTLSLVTSFIPNSLCFVLR